MKYYVEEFIKEKIEELNQKSDEDYTNVTIRLAPKDAIMLKAIAKGLNFSVSTAFTKILSMHAYDMIMGLDDKDFKDFLDKHYNYFYLGEYWLDHMIEKGILEEPDIKPSF